MATTAAIVTTKGLDLPPDFMAELDLKPGTQITVTLDDNRQALFDVERLISETRGMFAGGPSMADELIRERREDERRFNEKW